ncbi:T9SS type A sorting domain-containing protein [Flavobacterium sp.]|uniref:T9SS type A sorting domain-containing protein n=1 Tax=Flavobacterium sp. TaxID=239 RepID=UPI0039E48BC2
MKTKLLLLFSFASFCTFAQAPINSYYGTDGVEFSIIFDDMGIDMVPAGANVTWNMVNVGEIGTSIDDETTPTAGELTDFPGTTNVVTTTSTIAGVDSEFKIYSKHPGNVLSLTGIQNADLLLNYSTNNAALGLFPMNYGFTNTDNIAGNYDNGTYQGTFTGTINTSVDAWGTLTIQGDPGMTDFTGPVTRLKTVQNISLNYGIFTNVGTVTVTTYGYYNADLPNIPRFRSTVTTVVVPLLSLNQSFSQFEVFKSAPLAVDQMQRNAQTVVLAPNPVENRLQVLATDQKIQSVTLTDVTGKIVLSDYSQNSTIEVSRLQKGIYFATIATDSGSTTKKFVKK